jgi:hypothetical protein
VVSKQSECSRFCDEGERELEGRCEVEKICPYSAVRSRIRPNYPSQLFLEAVERAPSLTNTSFLDEDPLAQVHACA